MRRPVEPGFERGLYTSLDCVGLGQANELPRPELGHRAESHPRTSFGVSKQGHPGSRSRTALLSAGPDPANR